MTTMHRTVVLAACLSAVAAIQGCASGPTDPQRAADAEVKNLLLLMDKDKSGTVSKQEFMDFMSAEFDRLDVNKDGVLDVKELTQLRVRGLGMPHK